MVANSEQLDMLGERPPTALDFDVQEKLGQACQNRHHALIKCAEESGLTAKQIYGRLGMSQTMFSRIWSKNAFLDPDKKQDWMRVCGNIIPVHYDAFLVKCRLVPLRTGDQERIAELEEEVSELRKKLQFAVEMIRK